MRHFTVILTQEGRLRFRFLRKEHGLLHDRTEKKSYAVIHEAYPTNWAGRWSRAYLVHEESSQSVKVGQPPDAAPTQGATVRVLDPLSMVARIRLPGPRGERGEEREVHLTAESIFDRTMSAQVRRLGNRRIHWFHALLFASLGAFITLGLVAVIALFSGGGDAAPPATQGTPVLVPTLPQSGPVGESVVVVQSAAPPPAPAPGGG